ncbi:restriction endonuclease subunit S [Pediococcus acidilactici]|uniref:restriction endonuclease subunit S n=1 Tax=Pediococcus acidilactici TaxID=1254 RepID=UPI001150A769|nr:restriction endonuclease subunit S [Pediococcus acidilactici]QDJ22914.1 restriction endonuclease subunit S [Pediococcus acidilactici]
MSKDKKRLVPVRRFKEFENAPAWEQRKLGEVVEITMGQSPSSKNYTENPNDHILVQGNADMKNGHVVPRVWTTQITKQAEKGDLILSVRAPVGDIGKTDYDVVLGRGVAAIKGNSFIFQLLTKMKINGYWTRFSTGSTFESINSDNIKNAQISIPSLREQEKIGGLFNEFDSLIALHQRKLDKLKRVKSAYLTEMFPAEGEREPKRRFPGFTVAWEQRKLGDVVNRFDNLRIPVTASKRIHGEFPYYGANGIQDYVDGYTHNGEYILVAEDGASNVYDYPVNYVKGKVWVNNHAHVIQGKTNIADNLFLLNAIKSINIASFLVGGSRAKLNAEIMMELPIKIPSYNEQKKIGKYFANIDSLITLHQRKLDKLKKMKAAYLEEMFV